MYFFFQAYCFFLSTSFAISLWHSFVYLRDSPICKCEVGILDHFESFQTFFDVLTKILSNHYETDSFTNSFSDSVVNSNSFPFIGLYFDVMEVNFIFLMQSGLFQSTCVRISVV